MIKLSRKWKAILITAAIVLGFFGVIICIIKAPALFFIGLSVGVLCVFIFVIYYVVLDNV